MKGVKQAVINSTVILALLDLCFCLVCWILSLVLAVLLLILTTPDYIPA